MRSGHRAVGQQELLGRAFSLADFFARMNQSGTILFALIESDMIPADAPRGTPVP